MGRLLIRAREALRRAVGKPGRRSGVDRRKNMETINPYGIKGKYEYERKNPNVPGPNQRVSTFGPDRRSGKDRRKK